MDHQHIHEEKLVDYVLGHLPSKEHFKINAHLTTCSKCRNARDNWEKNLNVETKPIPSPHLKQRVFSEIDIRKNKFNVKWVYVAVSLCAVFLLCFSFFQTPKQEKMANHQTVVHLTSPNPVAGLQSTNPVHIKLQDISPTHLANDKIWLMDIGDFNYLYLNSLSTHPINEQSHITLLENDKPGEIFFVVDDSICSYDLENKQIYCVQTQIGSQLIQPIHIGSKQYFFK